MSNKNYNYSRKIKVAEYVFCFQGSDVRNKYIDNKGFSTLVLYINILDKGGTVVAEYKRAWDTLVHSANVYRFIDKFAQDHNYREQYRIGGEPISAEIPKTDILINPQCASAIQRINGSNPSKLKFRDFARLKTYGRDKVSSMKMDVLRDIVSEKELEQITEAVRGEDVVAVLRWIKRGLRLDHAIHKANVDREIADNAVRR